MKFISNYKNFLFEYQVGKHEISDIEKYLEGMSKGLSDKLFFIDKLDIECLVDFGSADGFILSKIKEIKPEWDLFGYDIDEQMINISKGKYTDISFSDDFSFIKEKIRGKKSAIYLSSVIHEIYSYSTGKDIKDFWNNLFNSGFDYIIIRDMMPSKEYEKMNLIEINKIRDNSDPKYLKEFEDYWGDIGRDFRNLLHWFLKYRYLTNWKRELKENYLPISIETLKSKILSNYEIEYENHYVLPFLKNQIKKDFDVDLKEPTHLKLILKSK